MEFTIDKSMWRSFLKQMDLMHTLNGGMSMTSLNTTETENNMVVSISAPTVKPEAFTIYIDRGKLMIYSSLKSNDTGKEQVAVPMFFKSLDIPFYVDGENIHAQYEDGKLNVILPFREGTGKLQRRVDIEQL